jgi:hypothetical protein
MPIGLNNKNKRTIGRSYVFSFKSMVTFSLTLINTIFATLKLWNTKEFSLKETKIIVLALFSSK